MIQRMRWRTYVAQTLHRSPLFSSLWEQMQDDPELLAFLDLMEEHQPPQILLFATVMFLLQAEEKEPLRLFYPYFNPHPLFPEQAYPLFREFCLKHTQDLLEILPFARLQTNEPQRCLPLLFAFHLVFERQGRLPLALIEIGSSMGLNLNWPYYGYHNAESWHVGDSSSPVQLCATFEGTYRPSLPLSLPTIASIEGIEMLPLDRASETDIAWVRACIWPEEVERYSRLDAALRIAEQHPPRIHPGDACEILPSLLSTIPSSQTLCIWHSFALNQGSEEVKEHIEEILAAESYDREIYRISLEVDREAGGKPRLELFTYRNGQLDQHEWLANSAIHGETVEWLLPQAKF